MPAGLRTMLARVLLLGVFLIPVGLASPRGLSHVLTCRAQVAAPFQVILIEGQAVVTAAQQLEPGDAALLCRGLDVDLTAAVVGPGRVEVTVPVRNTTESDWHGSVQLDVAGIRIPVDLGQVDAGETRRRQVTLDLPDGTVEFSGALLVGP
jgi:hypothetical protein